ncbi:MAG: hypothetical protein CM1200mP20_14470 [Pseudomonadota bacterium]|nr:MAG: hypothetical protein CM1200mP20_14470 [Pseudomonadota bacterium]
MQGHCVTLTRSPCLATRRVLSIQPLRGRWFKPDNSFLPEFRPHKQEAILRTFRCYNPVSRSICPEIQCEHPWSDHLPRH